MDFSVSARGNIYRVPAFRDIQPANIPTPSLDAIPPVSHPMAMEVFYDRWGRMVHRYVDGQTLNITA